MGGKAYQERQKAKGLCYACPRPIDGTGKRCLYHKKKHAQQESKSRQKYPDRNRIAARKVKQKRRENNRCITCGGPKDDPAYVKCTNCQDGIFPALSTPNHGVYIEDYKPESSS